MENFHPNISEVLHVLGCFFKVSLQQQCHPLPAAGPAGHEYCTQQHLEPVL